MTVFDASEFYRSSWQKINKNANSKLLSSKYVEFYNQVLENKHSFPTLKRHFEKFTVCVAIKKALNIKKICILQNILYGQNSVQFRKPQQNLHVFRNWTHAYVHNSYSNKYFNILKIYSDIIQSNNTFDWIRTIFWTLHAYQIIVNKPIAQ